MKIAVQFYGNLRTYQVCAPTIKKHLLDLYDADVFIHTWDRVENPDPSWQSYAKDPTLMQTPVDQTVIDEITELYNAKKILVEPQGLIQYRDGVWGSGPMAKCSLKGLKSLLYSRKKVNELRIFEEQEKDTIYDYVVMIRPDLMFFEDLKIEIYQYEFDFCEKASIQFLFQPPIIVTQNNKILHIPLAFDLFWFSKPSTMNMFINECYEKFEYYYVDFPQKALPPGVHAPEMSCEEIASQLGILPKFYLFPYKIKRKEDMYDCKSILL